jgi:hypothetical protein
LLPAFLTTDAGLRGHSHPSFIRWSSRNSNRARIIFLRAVGSLLFLLGTGLDIVLILSHQSHYLRILCLALWWPGLALLFAALRGLCLILHFHNLRQLRPWEQSPDLARDTASESDDKPGVAVTNAVTTTTITGGPIDSSKDVYDKYARGPKLSVSTVSTIISSEEEIPSGDGKQKGPDSMRKPTLQPFGPANPDANAAWARLYKARPLLQRLFSATVPLKSKALQMKQDRAIFFAVICAGLLSTAMTVASLFVPRQGLFL